jgi:hypothetical protein
MIRFRGFDSGDTIPNYRFAGGRDSFAIGVPQAREAEEAIFFTRSPGSVFMEQFRGHHT